MIRKEMLNPGLTPMSHSKPSFCVTLVGYNTVEALEIEAVLRDAIELSSLTIRIKGAVSDASFPAEVIHAIVFSSAGLAQTTEADADAARNATKPGTCRVYLSSTLEDAAPPAASRLDDFIQRTSAHSFRAVADEISAFFAEADKQNRHSSARAFRDMICLSAFILLSWLWPVSYVFAALHVFNAAAALSGNGSWLGTLAPAYGIPAATFFGSFFIVHCIHAIGRNSLFAAQIIKRLHPGFLPGAFGLGLAAAATGYSIAVTNPGVLRISISMILAASAYLFYLHARRIRCECTSLSGLQVALANSEQQAEIVSGIGRLRFMPSAFPLFPFRSKSLFVSYMHGSQWSSDTAALVHQWAVERGFKVFLDRSTIPSGSLWRQSLLRAISECGYFVAVIDGEAPATEWVLAESAYAAILRKNIGKPRILLVVRNLHRIAEQQMHPIHLLYLDVFQLPSADCYGAAVLPVGPGQLSPTQFMHALHAIRPMCLIS